MDLLKLIFWFSQLLGRIYDKVGNAKDAILEVLKTIQDKIDASVKTVTEAVTKSQTDTVSSFEKTGAGIVEAVNARAKESVEFNNNAFKAISDKLDAGTLGVKEDEVRAIFENTLPKGLLEEFRWDMK
jgi:hypothetical protein